MKKPLLMVIDDEADIANFVRYVGESVGFEVRVFDHVKAYQKASLEADPTAIIMDIVMPEIDGIELLLWHAKQGCSVPIILMSGYEKGDYLETAKRLGEARQLSIAGIMSKPIKFDELEAMFEDVLRVAA